MDRKIYKILLLVIFLSCTSVTYVTAQIDNSEQSEQPNKINRPPIIPQHEPVKKALENEPIHVTIDVQGARMTDKCIFNFREKGLFEFHTILMGYNPNTHLFECTITKQFHSNEVFEYYFEIFPEGLSSIRVPKNNDQFFLIHSYVKSAKLIRLVLLFILVLSPIIIAYFVRRIRRFHVKRTTTFKQKIKKRKRKLGREREKHYKRYLKDLTGTKRTGKVANSLKKSEIKIKTQPQEVTHSVAHAKDKQSIQKDKVSTGELKRELDEILDRRHSEDRSKPSEIIPRKKSVKPDISIPTALVTDDRPKDTDSTSKRKLTAEGEQDVGTRTDEITKPLGNEIKALDKSERNKLLDILGLDDI